MELLITAELGNGAEAPPTKLTVWLSEGRGSPQWSPGTVATADRVALALLGTGAMVSRSGDGRTRTYLPKESMEWTPVAPAGPTPR